MDVQERFDHPLEGRYRLDELIADKLYTTTYVAYDMAEEKVVAVDILKDEFAAERPFAAEFDKRMQTLAQINHPNLPKIFRVGRLPEGQPFAVREYIAGYPLTERLQQLAKQGLPVYSIYALRLVRQIADALSEAEQFKLFHHALSPESILLKSITMKSDDAVVLLDLGIPPSPRQTADLAYRLNGEQRYFAPEQQAHETADSRSHIYSLGVLLFELLTSERPAKIQAFWEPYVRPVIRSRTPMQKIRGDLSTETYILVNKCLRRESWQRFPTLTTFIEAVDKAIMAEDVKIRTMPEAVFTPKPSQRPFWLIIAAVLVIGSGSFFVLQGLSTNAATSTPAPSGLVVFTPTTESPQAVVATETAVPASPTAQPSNTATSPAEATATTIIAAESTATATPTSAATQTPTYTATATQQPAIQVVFSSANIRNGPGVVYDTIAYMLEGETAVVIARSQTADIWYNIVLNNGTRGWISNSVIETVGDLSNIPVAATIPPPPTPTMTPTATPTLEPTATVVETGGGGSSKPKATSTQPPLP